MSIPKFNYAVSWSDFSSLKFRPSGVNEDAQIHPEMSFSDIKLIAKGKSVAISDLEVNIDLVRSDCWVVESKKSDSLLAHEQGHYDILAISAREFYNTLKGLSATSTHELQKLVTSNQEKTARKVAAVDKQYDIMTKHGLDKPVQDKWFKSILQEKQKPAGSIDNLPR